MLRSSGKDRELPQPSLQPRPILAEGGREVKRWNNVVVRFVYCGRNVLQSRMQERSRRVK